MPTCFICKKEVNPMYVRIELVKEDEFGKESCDIAKLCIDCFTKALR